MRGLESIVVLMMFVGIPWTLGWITKLTLNHQRQMRILQLKADTASRLLDRFGSEPALLDFLKTEATHSLFDVKIPETGTPLSYSRTLTSIQLATFLLAGGAACLIYKFYSPRNYDQLAFLFMGTLGVSLGIGALVSAAAAFYAEQAWRSHQRTETDARP